MFFDERDRLLNQADLTHELASQRELPFFSGEFRKRSKCDFTCCNGHGIKRADGLIKLPDTFAVLDLDSEIARFASDLDYLMGSTRQCLLNQFPDLSLLRLFHARPAAAIVRARLAFRPGDELHGAGGRRLVQAP